MPRPRPSFEPNPFTFIFREDETDLVFPKEDFKPLSTLCPPAVPE